MIRIFIFIYFLVIISVLFQIAIENALLVNDL